MSLQEGYDKLISMIDRDRLSKYERDELTLFVKTLCGNYQKSQESVNDSDGSN